MKKALGAALVLMFVVAGVFSCVESNDPANVEASAAAVEAEASAAAAEAAKAAEAAASAAAAAEVEAAERAAVEAAVAAGTVAQQDTFRRAEEWLDLTSFSRSGLIEQLEREGFPTEDATWAVDLLSVDWNEQAAKDASAVLAKDTLSRSELIDFLIYVGFTQEQAEYGANRAGR